MYPLYLFKSSLQLPLVVQRQTCNCAERLMWNKSDKNNWLLLSC